MSRFFVAAAATCCLLGSSLWLALAPADAAESTPVQVAQTAAYTSPPDPHSSVVAPDPDTLSVAAGPLGETKRAVLSLELGGLAASAQVVLRISTVTGSSYGTPNGVQICRVDGAWEAGPGQALAEAPDAVCPDEPLLGEPRAASYAFDLTPLLAAPTGQLTIALLPAPGASALWQVAFEAAPDEQVGAAQLAASRPPPPEPAPTPTGDFAAPVTPPAQSDWSLAGPVSSDPLPAPPLPAPLPAPMPVSQPNVATAAQSAATKVAAYQPLPVNSWAWLLLPLGVALLLQVARVVLDDEADDGVPS